MFPLKQHSPVEAEDDCCHSHPADGEKVKDVVLFYFFILIFKFFNLWDRNKMCVCIYVCNDPLSSEEVSFLSEESYLHRGQPDRTAADSR